MPASKELDFFSNDKYFSQGMEYYLGFFPRRGEPGILCGEASPQYMYGATAPQRIHATLPDVRLIMCLRDPVERAASHLRMNQRRGLETRDLADAFRDFTDGTDPHREDPEFGYFRLGEYGRILQSYLNYFRREQILFVHADDLRYRRRSELERILAFLGADGQIPDDVLQSEFHASGRPRFAWLNRGIRKFSQLSPRINQAIKRVIGTRRVYYLLHKIETEWNIVAEKNAGQAELSAKEARSIAQYFSSDADLFERLAGYRLPWADNQKGAE